MQPDCDNGRVLGAVWMPGGLRVEVHLGADDTDGAFCLMVDHPPPGWFLPPHRHENEAETVCVSAGRFEMTVDGVRTELGPGDVVHVPRGVEHSGRSLAGEPGRRVLVFSPAGMERFFLEAGSAEPHGDLDLLRMGRLAQQHGWRFS